MLGEPRMAKPRVYLETSFFRYLVAVPRTDRIKAARQQVTTEWWAHRRANFELRVSQVVYDELGLLEPGKVSEAEAGKRSELVQAAELLPLDGAILEVARLLVEPAGPLPARAAADAIHWAVAAAYECEYVLTWNYRHLNNATIKRRAERILREHGYESPTICTPEELF